MEIGKEMTKAFWSIHNTYWTGYKRVDVSIPRKFKLLYGFTTELYGPQYITGEVIERSFHKPYKIWE